MLFLDNFFATDMFNRGAPSGPNLFHRLSISSGYLLLSTDLRSHPCNLGACWISFGNPCLRIVCIVGLLPILALSGPCPTVSVLYTRSFFSLGWVCQPLGSIRMITSWWPMPCYCFASFLVATGLFQSASNRHQLHVVSSSEWIFQSILYVMLYMFLCMCVMPFGGFIDRLSVAV